MPYRAARRPHVPAFLLVFAAIAACVSAPLRTPDPGVRVIVIPLDPDVYRITVGWESGRRPDDPETILLVRSAEVAGDVDAQFFFVVNATESILNTRWLAPGSVTAPTQIAPANPAVLDVGPAGSFLSAVIRVYRRRAPLGYPLFDAQGILRERPKPSAR